MSQSISIQVKTHYLPDQSTPAKRNFAFGYTITLENHGSTAARLISRHWIITDANDAVQEVQGLGVVGEQPRLKPGEHFTYSSGVILETQTGTMQGTYQMITDDGTRFDAEIPAFALVTPNALH